MSRVEACVVLLVFIVGGLAGLFAHYVMGLPNDDSFSVGLCVSVVAMIIVMLAIYNHFHYDPEDPFDFRDE